MYFTCIDILLFLKVRGISCFLHSMCYLYLYGIFLKHFRSFGSFGPFEGKCLAHRDPLGFGAQAPRAHGGVEPVRDLRLRGRCGSLLLQGEDHGGLLWTGWTGWVTAGQKMGIFLGSDISLVIWFEFHCHTELQLLFDFVLRRNGWRWNWIQRTLNQSSAEPNQIYTIMINYGHFVRISSKPYHIYLSSDIPTCFAATGGGQEVANSNQTTTSVTTSTVFTTVNQARWDMFHR